MFSGNNDTKIYVLQNEIDSAQQDLSSWRNALNKCHIYKALLQYVFVHGFQGGKGRESQPYKKDNCIYTNDLHSPQLCFVLPLRNRKDSEVKHS